MTRMILGGAQMGAIQKADSRARVVARMIDLLNAAAAKGVGMLVYPELALTTFFPRWYMEDQAEVDGWFETAMPNAATAPLFARARDLNIAITFGYAELTPQGRHFNTSILTDRTGAIVGRYRKVHLPGHDEYEPTFTFQHLEKRYFEPGDLGFPVWRNEGVVMGMAICNDRRWPEVYRCLGLQGVELVTIGYNTPSTNAQMAGEDVAKRLYHSELSLTAGAYQNSTFVAGIAKAGVEDGHPADRRLDPRRPQRLRDGPRRDRGRRADRRRLRLRRVRLRQGHHLRLRPAPPRRALRPHHRAGRRARRGVGRA